MNFFLDFLSHFSATDILNMYGDGAFRTSEEIKLADFMINFKVIFNDNHISSDDLEIYKHLQRVVDTIRAQQILNRSIFSTIAGDSFNYCLEEVHFNYFVKYNEYEVEMKRFCAYGRRITFALKYIEDNVSSLMWLENALEELLNYMLRNFEDQDRVGVVIKYENYEDRNAVFPIKLKNHLRTSIVVDTLNSMVNTRSSIVTGLKMDMQVVRIRLPILYKKLTTTDVMLCTGNQSDMLI